MEKEKFIALLSKKLSEQLALDEIESLDSIISQNEEYRVLANKLENYFQQKEDINLHISQLDQIWKTIEISEREDLKMKFNYFQQKPIYSSFKNLLKAAAVLVILAGTSIFSYKLLNRNTAENFESLISTNAKIFKLLDDGTKIWLNKNSKLSYNTAFGAKKREIILDKFIF